jgi:hypothetical protein
MFKEEIYLKSVISASSSGNHGKERKLNLKLSNKGNNKHKHRSQSDFKKEESGKKINGTKVSPLKKQISKKKKINNTNYQHW